MLHWYHNGVDFIRSRTENRDLFFRGGITWSDISTGLFCARKFVDGQLFDAAGPVIIPYGDISSDYMLAFMNTKVFQSLIDIICQGLHYGNGAVVSRPIVVDENNEELAISLARQNVQISNSDWDSFETSWDFAEHPLVRLKDSMKFTATDGNRACGRKVGLLRIVTNDEIHKRTNSDCITTAGFYRFSKKGYRTSWLSL